MRTIRPLILVVAIAAAAAPSSASTWSIGGGTGPFVFGKFAQRTLLIATEDGTASNTITISAATRTGLSVDLEASLNSWLALRGAAAFTHTPLTIKNGSSKGVELSSGKMDVTTFTLPFVVHFSRHGAVRAHLLGGPAYALYHGESGSANGPKPVFEGTRSRFGGCAGAGLAWWLGNRLAIEGEVVDIVTSSPLVRSDFPSRSTGVHLLKTNNVHTTVGLRYSF